MPEITPGPKNVPVGDYCKRLVRVEFSTKVEPLVN